MSSSVVELVIRLDDEGTSDPIVTIDLVSAFGVLKIMGEPSEETSAGGRGFVLRKAHIESASAVPNSIGPGGLRRICDEVCRTHGYEYIEIEGAVRTTGANPGTRPRPFRHRRRL